MGVPQCDTSHTYNCLSVPFHNCDGLVVCAVSHSGTTMVILGVCAVVTHGLTQHIGSSCQVVVPQCDTSHTIASLSVPCHNSGGLVVCAVSHSGTTMVILEVCVVVTLSLTQHICSSCRVVVPLCDTACRLIGTFSCPITRCEARLNTVH